MEININVSEEKFNEVLQKELDAFPKDELKEIIRDCIVKKLMDDTLISNLLTYENSFYSSSGYREPSTIMKQVAEQIDLSPAFKEVQDKMITYMKENYQELMTKIMSNIMVQGLTANNNFQNAVYDAINRELYNRENYR